MPRLPLRSLVALAVLCAASSLGAQSPTPLAEFAGAKLAVLPSQLVRMDSAWSATRDGRAQLRLFDDSLAAAVAEAGFEWVPPGKLVEAARRNRGYAADPTALLAQPLRRLKAQDPLPEGFAGRLRTVMAFTEARFALVPVELQLPGTDVSQDRDRPVILAQVIDARAQRVLWTGLVRGEPMAHGSPAALGALARKLVSLAGTP